MTCLPALAAATAGSMWAPLGVAMVTASTVVVGQHRVERVVAAAAEFRGEGVGAAGRRVGAGDELGAADVGQGLGVKATDHAGADDAESDGHGEGSMGSRVQGSAIDERTMRLRACAAGAIRIMRVRTRIVCRGKFERSDTRPAEWTGDVLAALHVVLYQPEIPYNTGSVGRTCVAVGAKLWLVRPLGFRVDDYYLRRAGLDYWQHLEWQVVDDWAELTAHLPVERHWYFTKKADAAVHRRGRSRRATCWCSAASRAGLPDGVARPRTPSGACGFRRGRRCAASTCPTAWRWRLTKRCGNGP